MTEKTTSVIVASQQLRKTSSVRDLGPDLVWYPDLRTKLRACASGKEGSGTKLYPNAGPGILISVGRPLISECHKGQSAVEAVINRTEKSTLLCGAYSRTRTGEDQG